MELKNEEPQLKSFTSDLLHQKYRWKKTKPESTEKVLDLLKSIHEAIVEHAISFFSSKEQDDKECEIYDILNDGFYVATTLPKGKRDICSQLIEYLENNINVVLWGIVGKERGKQEEFPVTPEIRRKYVLNSILQSFRDRMDTNNREDRCEMENAWFALGCLLLVLVSGSTPLKFKDPLTVWTVPIIGEASKMLIRGLENIRYKLTCNPSIKADYSKENEPFKDIALMSDTNQNHQAYGKPGFFFHLQEPSSFNYKPPEREFKFFKLMENLSSSGDLLGDPENSVLTSIVDVLLDFRVFSDTLVRYHDGTFIGITTQTSDVYFGFLQLIDLIISPLNGDDEETIDAKEAVREIICCLFICVDSFWRTVMKDDTFGRISWKEGGTSPMNRKEELFAWMERGGIW